MKRTIDVTLASILLLILSPLMLAIAIAVWCADGGSPLFSQERIGQGGRRFRCHKFRTMRADAEALLAEWRQTEHPLWRKYVQHNFKLDDDPRITLVGRFLRRSSLDELPQLFNVLKGEMSLVGPRPLLEREIGDYGAAAFEEYIRVRPGITGLWQISGRSNTSFAERVELDRKYVRRQSLLVDLAILVQTIPVVLRREGAR